MSAIINIKFDFIGLSLGNASATTILIYHDKDIVINDDSPTFNYGCSELRVNHSKTFLTVSDVLWVM